MRIHGVNTMPVMPVQRHSGRQASQPADRVEFGHAKSGQAVQFGGWFRKKPTPAQQMMSAIERNDLDAVKKALDDGLGVNQYTDGDTPLMRAAWHRHPEMVDLLLARGAKPELRAYRGRTALMHIFDPFRQPETTRHTQVVEKLAVVSNVNARDLDGETALNLAVHYGFDNAALVLLRQGANPMLAEKKHGLNPLMYAAWRGEADLVRRIVDAVPAGQRQAFINMENRYGNSAMHMAKVNERWEAVKVLRELGAIEKPNPWYPDEPPEEKEAGPDQPPPQS